MNLLRRLSCLVALAAAGSVALPAFAAAGGGSYAFDGGNPYEQAQVRAGLAASAFDWNLVPAQITIHIVRGIPSSEATPGEIWLDADLLDAGSFSWGVVQHEYAHQVDFSLLDEAKQSQLRSLLGGKDWYPTTPGLVHSDHGCERFASTLAWAYWPSPLNSMRPRTIADESAAMAPAAFRTLLVTLISAPDRVLQRTTRSAR